MWFAIDIVGIVTWIPVGFRPALVARGKERLRALPVGLLFFPPALLMACVVRDRAIVVAV
jgi:hypothetical protein